FDEGDESSTNGSSSDSFGSDSDEESENDATISPKEENDPMRGDEGLTTTGRGLLKRGIIDEMRI
ncbi:hypothetical protein HAX54_006250, partial [Datura stramonium]|nr:hypothetical protein [Datura stramonium]